MKAVNYTTTVVLHEREDSYEGLTQCDELEVAEEIHIIEMVEDDKIEIC